METDYSKIEEKIYEFAEKFGANGALLANCEGKTVLSTSYGKNLLTEEPVTAKSRYLMPLDCPSMLSLCAFVLIDEGKLRISDKISKFIPEFEHAEKITVKNLLYLCLPFVAQRITHPTRIREEAGSVSGLASWVKDLALP